jgi:phosphate:Na+ symporter
LLPAKHLDPDYLGEPGLAFTMVRRELGRIGRRLEPLLEEFLQLLQRLGPAELAHVQQLQTDVSMLYDQLTAYLGQASQRELPDPAAGEFLGLLRAANGLHHITHLIANLAEDLDEDGRPLAQAVAEYAEPFHAAVLEAVHLALHAIEFADQEAAQAVSAQKPVVNAQLRELRLKAAAQLARRRAGARPGHDGSAGFEAEYAQLMNLLEHEKRIFYFARRSARTVLPPDPADEPVTDSPSAAVARTGAG